MGKYYIDGVDLPLYISALQSGIKVFIVLRSTLFIYITNVVWDIYSRNSVYLQTMWSEYSN
jgi:hypothetical protein